MKCSLTQAGESTKSVNNSVLENLCSTTALCCNILIKIHDIPFQPAISWHLQSSTSFRNFSLQTYILQNYCLQKCRQHGARDSYCEPIIRSVSNGFRRNWVWPDTHSKHGKHQNQRTRIAKPPGRSHYLANTYGRIA